MWGLANISSGFMYIRLYMYIYLFLYLYMYMIQCTETDRRLGHDSFVQNLNKFKKYKNIQICFFFKLYLRK